MFKTICLLLVGLASIPVQAMEIATCRSPKGQAYYHFGGLMKKSDSGWHEDNISAGTISFTRGQDGSVDILYVDVRKKPISSTQDGGIVRLLRVSQTSATVLVFYPNGASTEIYTFFTEKDDSHKFSMLSSKSGDQAIIPKSALMVGSCDPIRFDLLP